MNHESLLDKLLEIADAAGEKVMAIYQTDFEVQTKEDNSPITEADIASHQTLDRPTLDRHPSERTL